MAKKKKGLMPKVEILIILVFFFSFIIWAVSRCKATRLSYQEKELVENATSLDTEEPEAEANAEPTPATDKDSLAQESPNNQASLQSQSLPNYSTLYVTIDNLNLRTGPSLDSAVIISLPLYEEVSFMNEVTDFKQTLSLGKETANEPWVKVKSKKGHIGWVYGAGVHYYKMKRAGVIE